MRPPAGRRPPVPRSLWLMLVLACTSKVTHRDSATVVADAAPAETASDSLAPLALDTRAGLSSGSACDAATACASGACLLGTCSDWARAARIVIDTTSTGAGIRQAIDDFPLLVRLTAANFDFRQASKDGADVRFLDPAGRTLAHQTERWDATQGLAELWVAVPRIEPNRQDNVVLMYWGNPLAPSLSSAPAVFDHLTCALHMDAASDGIAAHLQDASGHGNTGNLPNRLPGLSANATQVEGIAGAGLGLDGNRDYLVLMLGAQSPQRFAVSLWFRAAGTAAATLAEFASRVSGGGVRLDRTIRMDERGLLSFGVLRTTTGLVTASSLTGYRDGYWHHLVARSGDNGQTLFVDGEPIADNPSRSGSTNNTGGWYVGADPPPAGSGALPSNCFAGTIDELQLFADSEPSDDWIKLSYATQRPGATVLSIQALP
jgi:hypothetical protein